MQFVCMPYFEDNDTKEKWMVSSDFYIFLSEQTQIA